MTTGIYRVFPLPPFFFLIFFYFSEKNARPIAASIGGDASHWAFRDFRSFLSRGAARARARRRISRLMFPVFGSGRVS